jgi:thiol-disulfide isomerase/thioredoxin
MRLQLAILAASLLAGTGATQRAAPAQEPASQSKQQKKKKKPKLLKVGSLVPADVALPGLDGKTHKMGDYRGKIVFVHFWSIRCPWEKYAEPVILGMEKKYKGKDVVLLAINANRTEIGEKPPVPVEGEKAKPYANLRKHVKRVNFGHTVLIDHGNKVADLFQARTTPHCYVIDKKGIIRYAGGLDDYGSHRTADKVIPHSQNAIDALLAGKKPEVTSSRPYG